MERHSLKIWEFSNFPTLVSRHQKLTENLTNLQCYLVWRPCTVPLQVQRPYFSLKISNSDSNTWLTLLLSITNSIHAGEQEAQKNKKNCQFRILSFLWSIMADKTHLKFSWSLVFETMGKGIQIHPRKIFSKKVRPDLLFLEIAIFFKIGSGVFKLRTCNFSSVRTRDLNLLGVSQFINKMKFLRLLKLSRADFVKFYRF